MTPNDLSQDELKMLVNTYKKLTEAGVEEQVIPVMVVGEAMALRTARSDREPIMQAVVEASNAG